MSLNLRLFPDRLLKIKCKKVTAISGELRSRVKSMTDTLYTLPGLALAAPQVGLLDRVAVLNMKKINAVPEILVLINPVIISSGGKIKLEEGCLSLPDVFEDIVRPEKIKVEGMDLDGKKIDFEADDIFARVIQHEIDHLDGILFWDHLPGKKREALKAKFLEKISTENKT